MNRNDAATKGDGIQTSESASEAEKEALSQQMYFPDSDAALVMMMVMVLMMTSSTGSYISMAES